MRKLVSFNEMATINDEFISFIISELENEKKFSYTIGRLDTPDDSFMNSDLIINWEEEFLGKNIKYELSVFRGSWYHINLKSHMNGRMVFRLGFLVPIIRPLSNKENFLENLQIFKNYTQFRIEFPAPKILKNEFLNDLESEMDIKLELEEEQDMLPDGTYPPGQLPESTLISGLPNGYYCVDLVFKSRLVSIFGSSYWKLDEGFLDELEKEIIYTSSNLGFYGLCIKMFDGKENYIEVNDFFKSKSLSSLFPRKDKMPTVEATLQIFITK